MAEREKAAVAAPTMPFSDFWKVRVDIVKAFCETAKIYVQLSAAALALPLLFTEAMLGKTAADKGLRVAGLPLTLLLAWVCFLIAIACGLVYQWLIVRLMWDELHDDNWTPERAERPGFRKTKIVLQPGWFNRSYVYGEMVGFFFAGAVLFLVFAAWRL